MNFKEVCIYYTTGGWFSLGTPVSSTDKTDRQDIPEILLKVALNTINHPKPTIFKIFINDFTSELDQSCEPCTLYTVHILCKLLVTSR